MSYSIQIETGNDAFQPDPAQEIARILRTLADKLEAGADLSEAITLRDYNGNNVGAAIAAD